jgi:hypothetical protein
LERGFPAEALDVLQRASAPCFSNVYYSCAFFVAKRFLLFEFFSTAFFTVCKLKTERQDGLLFPSSSLA